jgi:hypothetical protein
MLVVTADDDVYYYAREELTQAHIQTGDPVICHRAKICMTIAPCQQRAVCVWRIDGRAPAVPDLARFMIRGIFTLTSRAAICFQQPCPYRR